ncbi:MAG TPA: polyphosphate kinase 1 [Fimbriimonas sp.]
MRAVSPDARYLNRELSWLKFNRRVLEEAANRDNPLLERLRFLAIFESNLDEFYMVRVSGLIEQFESGMAGMTPDGLSPNEQLAVISETAEPQRRLGSEIYRSQIKPELERHGVFVRSYGELSDKQREEADRYFARVVFPLCTPVMLHPTSSIPFISNRSLNLAVELSDGTSDLRLARVKVPSVVPRAFSVGKRGRFEFVLLEEIIANNLQSLFPGVEILSHHAFRVVRDADVEVREAETSDMIATIEETIRLRRYGDPVLLVHEPTMPGHLRKFLMGMLELDKQDVFSTPGPLGFDVFNEIARIDKPNLRYRPHVPHLAEPLSNSKSIFEAVHAGDVLLHHPYDSFRTVEEFVGSAATDPDVIGIKQTLYRVGTESPLVESLLDAAESGKQVAAMVELKARFDEVNNLGWARALERAGVHVAHGFPEMKTHCKLALVVRKEKGGVRSYAHIGTGNYNPATARLYSDLGLMTDDEEITQDISELFNYLTGFSRQTRYRKLIVAPLNLREALIENIRRETKLGKRGHILWKLNALVDPPVIDALYEASAAGVRIDLNVRGVCCLRPGLKGLSENIQVVSIVGRFLEHSRIFYFGNEGNPKAMIGSADVMRRNMDRRIEVIVPVEDPRLVAHLRDHILDTVFRDTVKAWQLQEDGAYVRRKPAGGAKPFNSQEFFMEHPSTRELLRRGLADG